MGEKPEQILGEREERDRRGKPKSSTCKKREIDAGDSDGA